MRPPSADGAGSSTASRTSQQARIRISTLLLVVAIVGLGVGAFWYYRTAEKRAANTDQAADWLSDATKAVLQRLDSPIEIRFYSLLDPASVPDSVKAFSGRVDQLLSAYQREADGKIQVVRYNSLSDSNAAAASADGMRPFNLDKGDACYLGIAVTRNGQKESLPSLAPEWEQAVEFDLSRAIERLINLPQAGKPIADSSKPDPAVTEAVKRAIPNFASVSVEDGTRVLREAALNEFKAVAREEAKAKAAQQRLERAQTEAEQQAAMEQLQQFQAEQTEKLQQIAARLQAQITAFEQLKGATTRLGTSGSSKGTAPKH